MTIEFTLNGKAVKIKTEAERRLIDILRKDFRLTGAKCGCLGGKCGACTIIFNGLAVPSCLVPAFRVRGSQVITIEGFALTDAYADIVQGFKEASVENCGFCDSEKILTAEIVLSESVNPARSEIVNAFKDMRCRCTVLEYLIEGVQAAARIRTARLNNAEI
ncbi:MAG: 2Fe-2S iron-sulfur cluster-binding protein [Termitinemataceae bacterium]|nr:MAG: 2Fe-2S iron-sulfur cluster-binding protein [Termitinemataceae bacterium]